MLLSIFSSGLLRRAGSKPVEEVDKSMSHLVEQELNTNHATSSSGLLRALRSKPEEEVDKSVCLSPRARALARCKWDNEYMSAGSLQVGQRIHEHWLAASGTTNASAGSR